MVLLLAVAAAARVQPDKMPPTPLAHRMLRQAMVERVLSPASPGLTLYMPAVAGVV
jgi:hypothetical protein